MGKHRVCTGGRGEKNIDTRLPPLTPEQFSPPQGYDDLPAWRHLRQPETGLVMVRGRTGGAGQPFNLGEMTVTRCAVRLDDGTVGLVVTLGRGSHQCCPWVAALPKTPSELAARIGIGPPPRRLERGTPRGRLTGNPPHG